MCTDVGEQKNKYLDQLLADRRSHRMFTADLPEEEDIRRILHAGLPARMQGLPWGDRRITSGVSL